MFNYFKLTPFEKVKLGYITWTNNFKYQQNKTKFYLQIIPFFRYVFNKPIVYDKKLKLLKNDLLNTSQLNVEKWYKDKQKISL